MDFIIFTIVAMAGAILIKTITLIVNEKVVQESFKAQFDRRCSNSQCQQPLNNKAKFCRICGKATSLGLKTEFLKETHNRGTTFIPHGTNDMGSYGDSIGNNDILSYGNSPRKVDRFLDHAGHVFDPTTRKCIYCSMRREDIVKNKLVCKTYTDNEIRGTPIEAFLVRAKHSFSGHNICTKCGMNRNEVINQVAICRGW